MRAIEKGPEPAELREYRATPGVTYDGKAFTPVKDRIRADLLRDQGWLCCYCTRRISGELRPNPARPHVPPVYQMKVEHWQSQAGFPALQLVWTNMLGACLGGEGSPRADHTCDTRKGEDAITLNPLDPAHISTLRCRSTGYLESTDPRFQQDIDERLGLNHRILVSERRVMLDRVLHRLKARYPRSSFPIRALRAAIGELEASVQEKLIPLGFVLRLWARGRFGGEL